ncbi:hypothetical protein [Thermohalobacter berrensis]|uniref:Uncharacterized protein n=1 Tax=Thermohalobacter berrensis TaxID=99594 RepID=A0A419T779_9FIRM|nr:hypothetical protein [Thermohalobacter berrensis]RKD33447.1 hypothetical protein BET03_09350 [Thermohalobacter berrensis]
MGKSRDEKTSTRKNPNSHINKKKTDDTEINCVLSSKIKKINDTIQKYQQKVNEIEHKYKCFIENTHEGIVVS